MHFLFRKSKAEVREWRIKPLSHTATPESHRVSFAVAGREIWFESADAPLMPAPEAAACIFLVPALHFGARLRFDQPLDAVWLANARKLLPIFARWWNYPQEWPIEGDEAPSLAGPQGDKTAQCFSGGVDSFFSLLRGEYAPEKLLFVQGFDIALRDRRRLAAQDRMLDRVGAGLDQPVIRVKTNLREHPVFRKVDWRRVFGAALSGVAHFLGTSVRRLVIPPTFKSDFTGPSGSHHLTDPLWSGSHVDIVHGSTLADRFERLRAIADHPLVAECLTVCWKRRGAGGNCSRCEKCVRTMAGVAALGRNRAFTVFDGSMSLAQRVDRLPPLKSHLRHLWTEMLEGALSEQDRQAVLRLLERTDLPASNLPWLDKLLRRFRSDAA